MCLLGLKQQRLIWAKCFVFLGFYIYTWHCIFIHRTYSFPVGQKSDGSKGLLKEDLIIICIDKRYIADEVIAGWLDSSLGCSLALYKNWPISWTDDKLNDSMTALAALCHHQRWAELHTCNDASLPWTPKSYNYIRFSFPFFSSLLRFVFTRLKFLPGNAGWAITSNSDNWSI
jgi:hypothetical protein